MIYISELHFKEQENNEGAVAKIRVRDCDTTIRIFPTKSTLAFNVTVEIKDNITDKTFVETNSCSLSILEEVINALWFKLRSKQILTHKNTIEAAQALTKQLGMQTLRKKLTINARSYSPINNTPN